MKHIQAVFAFLVTVGAAAPAAAERLGALQIEVSAGVPANVRTSVQQTVARVGSSGRWTFTDEATMRGKMAAVTRDCFTADCLRKAGDATGADAGVRVRFSGEAQIFDWTIDVYDLHKGELAASRKGACELCGAAEVLAEFEKSAIAALDAANISSGPVVAEKPAGVATPPREEQPPPLDRPVAEPPPTLPATPSDEDPAAGLVMVEINVTPADASIAIGGQEVGQGSVTVSLEHGSYEIAFRREGYGGLNETLVVGPDTSRKAFLRVHLARTDPAAVGIPREGAIDELGDRRQTLGLVSLGAGGAFLLGGVWMNYLDGRPTCDDAGGNCPRVYETSVAAFLFTATGAVLATGGVALLAWDLLAGEPHDARQARVAPLLGADRAGLTFFTRF